MRSAYLYDENLKPVLVKTEKDANEGNTTLEPTELTKKKRNREDHFVTDAQVRSKCRNKRRSGIKSSAVSLKLKTNDDVYVEFYKDNNAKRFCTSKEIMKSKIQSNHQPLTTTNILTPSLSGSSTITTPSSDVPSYTELLT